MVYRNLWYASCKLSYTLAGKIFFNVLILLVSFTKQYDSAGNRKRTGIFEHELFNLCLRGYHGYYLS